MPPLIEGDAPSATIADQACCTASFPGTLAPMARAGASGCASIPQMSFLMGARMDAGSTITSPFEKLIQMELGPRTLAAQHGSVFSLQRCSGGTVSSRCSLDASIHPHRFGCSDGGHVSVCVHGWDPCRRRQDP